MTQKTRTYKDVSNFDNWTSKDFAPGAVIVDPGNSALYITGGWRSNRPIWTKENCNDCMLCWVYCPDSSILVEDQKMIGIDLDHCKGCGVCAVECRFEALEMISEPEALKAEGGN
ncbi:MAG: 4Fe-4S binding protein [Coriobacteriia bacterium]|nr:4Fe-4S binding protein [Coriobacteriia bacterium]